MESNSPRYTNRLNTLDLMRGWFLVVIAFDHLLLVPSLFDIVTGRGLLWVSAAEGFFFISGMLVGLVRGRQMLRHGLGVAARRVWVRAAKLYAASVVLTVLAMLAGYWLQDHGISAPKGGLEYFPSLGSMAYSVLNLNYTYGWADFLSFYAIFLALSPIVLWLLKRRLWWLVVWASLSLWLVKDHVSLPFLSFYAVWQVYFFLGLVFGYHFESVQSYFRLLPRPISNQLRVGAVILSGLTIIASFIFTFGTPFFANHAGQLAEPLRWLHLPPPESLYRFFYAAKENDAFKQLLQNNRTGILRLPLFLLWFAALFIVVRRYEAAILRSAGWLLVPLGRNSLYVYIIQSLIAFTLPLANIPPAYFVNTFVEAAAIMVCWVAVRQRFLFQIIPR